MLGEHRDEIARTTCKAGRQKGVIGSEPAAAILGLEDERLAGVGREDANRIAFIKEIRLPAQPGIGLLTIELVEIAFANKERLRARMARIDHHIGLPTIGGETEAAFERQPE